MEVVQKIVQQPRLRNIVAPLARTRTHRRVVTALRRYTLRPEEISTIEQLMGTSDTMILTTPLSVGFCNKVLQVETEVGRQVIKVYSEISKLRTRAELR